MKKLITLFSIAFLILSTKSCTKPSSTDVSYNGKIKSIITNNCSTCHGSANGVGGFSLATYSEVKQYTQSGNLLDRINDANNPMPSSGLMSQANRDAFQNWANGGYAE